MKAFRKQNNLDMSSLVIVHDGDADAEREGPSAIGKDEEAEGFEKQTRTEEQSSLVWMIDHPRLCIGDIKIWFEPITNDLLHGHACTWNMYIC